MLCTKYYPTSITAKTLTCFLTLVVLEQPLKDSLRKPAWLSTNASRKAGRQAHCVPSISATQFSHHSAPGSRAERLTGVPVVERLTI